MDLVVQQFNGFVDDVIAGDLFAVRVLGAVVIGLLIFVLVFFTSGKSKNRQILFCGLCDSGKTSLFMKLTQGRTVQTYTSIKENTCKYQTAGNKTIELVDLPGHEKVRYLTLEKYKSGTRALVFVLDSNTIHKEIKDAAEYLFTLLTDSVLHGSRVPLLVACHKADGAMAKTPSAVRTFLEREITTLRKTRAAQLQSTDGSGNSSHISIGKRDADFSFDDLKGHKLTFCESFITSDDSNIQNIEDWLSKVA